MFSWVELLPERARRPILDADEWPHDPLNMAIMLACFYVFIPLVGILATLFLIRGWNDDIPRWLDFSLILFLLVVGWIALDEWRSRRRSMGGEGHGWIWQMVERYGPRRPFNRMMAGLALLAIVAARLVAYLDRFVSTDLQGSSALFLAEVVFLTPVTLWAVAVVIAWRRSHGSAGDSFIYRTWWTTVFCLSDIALFIAFASTSDVVSNKSNLLFLLWILIFFPGWAIESSVNRIRGRPEAVAEGVSSKVSRPAWW